MSEELLSAVLEVESHTEETRSFMERVRRITRRRFTPEKKTRIVLDGFRHDVPVSDLCRSEGIRSTVFSVSQ
jgi:transposase-like protein